MLFQTNTQTQSRLVAQLFELFSNHLWVANIVKKIKYFEKISNNKKQEEENADEEAYIVSSNKIFKLYLAKVFFFLIFLHFIILYYILY